MRDSDWSIQRVSNLPVPKCPQIALRKSDVMPILMQDRKVDLLAQFFAIDVTTRQAGLAQDALAEDVYHVRGHTPVVDTALN